MRIGIITSWNVRCGIAEYAAFLADAFQHQRVDVRIFSNFIKQTLVREDTLNVTRVWSNDRASLPSLISAVRENELDGVIVEYHPGFYSLELLAEMVERLSSVCFGVVVCPHRVQGDGLDFLACSAKLSLATAIQVHRQSDKSYLESQGLRNICIIPQGVYVPDHVDLMNWASVPVCAGRVEDADVVICSFGFLMPHKGYAELISACALLKQRLPKLRLKIYSSLYPGSESAVLATYLRMFARQLGAGSWCVIDTDFHETEDVVARLHEANVIVFGYQHTEESSSAAVRMALAAGRPTVCTPLAIFDDVQDAVVMADGTNPFSIADRVWNLLHDNAAMQDLVRRQAEYLATYSWTAVATRLLKVLNMRKDTASGSYPRQTALEGEHAVGMGLASLGVALGSAGRTSGHQPTLGDS